MKTLTLLFCLFLAACGGGDATDAPAYSTSAYCSSLPGNMYCFTMAYLKPGQRVSVTVDGRVTGAGSRVQAVTVDDVQHGPVTTSAGNFHLQYGFIVSEATEGWHKVGFSSEVVSGSSAVAENALISVEAR